MRKISSVIKRIQIILECVVDKDKWDIFAYLANPFNRTRFTPYMWSRKYDSLNIPVYFDDGGYPYVIHNSRKLFLKKGWSKSQCVDYYKSLLVDQDDNCSHCYLKSTNRLPGWGGVWQI